jgi:RNA methyltransferase, TrmH family
MKPETVITSNQNPLVKQVMDLREPKGRKAQGLILIDGAREVSRAIEAGVKIEKLFYCPTLAKETINASNAIEVSPKVFEKLAYGQRLDGVIAIASVKRKHFDDLKLPDNPLIVVVESVEKPGNLGAILRTCDGAGVDAVLVGDAKTDLYNPNVIRASLGAVFSVPSASGTNDDIAAFLKKKNIKTLGTFVDAKEVYTKANLKGPLAIVLGTEDHGLSNFWKGQCDLKVKIPMKGQADSLNVSVSAAVVIYEALRQRS